MQLSGTKYFPTLHLIILLIHGYQIAHQSAKKNLETGQGDEPGPGVFRHNLLSVCFSCLEGTEWACSGGNAMGRKGGRFLEVPGAGEKHETGSHQQVVFL